MENPTAMNETIVIQDATDSYYSVEILKNNPNLIYMFKIRGHSPKGTCIISVRNDSYMLKGLNIGDVLDIKYHSEGKSDATEYKKTRIAQITKKENGRFKGHCLVALAELERIE